ncbi:unnamed protein product [Clonostachys rosea f. rosea IK726]|uniref:Uncharacterized protein n=1 Tax=Clonostachys rosea f. rosea IK726 TaxID=1349383 RepID=A0ACA9T936_BIOOC|nr:unnamed protein product [Clonostachys rosea f. rosea IK726]
MKSSLLLLGIPVASAAVAPRQNYFSFGNYFSTGAVATNSWIRQATTTLILPALNSPHNGNLGLWPGMGTKFGSGADGHLIQGLAISTVGFGSPCNLAANENKWGAKLMVLRHTEQILVTVLHMTYNDATSKFDQTVSVNGNVVSTLSTASGHGAGWGTAMECQQVNCGTVPLHHYVDTKIIMNTADPNYSRTVATLGASGNLVTADGGKTWTAADITIQQYTFT